MSSNLQCPVCESRNLVLRPEHLRDSKSIRVLSCTDCSHVFLDSFDHLDEAYFVNDEFLLSKPFLQGLDERKRHFEHENQERLARIGPLVVNRRVLEFGCGAGSLMAKIKPLALEVEGVERTTAFRDKLLKMGYIIHKSIEEVSGKYKVILMFHVLEHLSDPVDTIRKCISRLDPDGVLYIEVPNVNDALLTLYDVEAYHDFHFFRDHLHYFSRSSLEKTIRLAGAQAVTISGHNRFGLANHLYWLKTGKPGGHKVWNFLETPSLFREYTRALAAADLSDSLIAQIRTS